MSSTYVPPQFNLSAFNCPQCGAYAKQDWFRLELPHYGGSGATAAFMAICAHCHRSSHWLNIDDRPRMTFPESTGAPPPHPDMPSEIAADYLEAAGVSTNSYRAAAALLRLALQRLMPHLGESGKNINADIASLVAKGLPVRIQQALDLCRVVGNESVHPGEITSEDGPELVSSLFSMLNIIVEDRITRPKEVEAMYRKLPEKKRNGIDARDAANGKPASPVQADPATPSDKADGHN